MRLFKVHLNGVVYNPRCFPKLHRVNRHLLACVWPTAGKCQSLRIQSRHFLPFETTWESSWKQGLSAHLRGGTLTAQRTSLNSVSQSTSLPRLQAAHGGQAEMHCSAGHLLCITFPISPHNTGTVTWRGFASAAPLSASLDEDWIGVTAESAGSYRCRRGAFVLDHLSERISPLVRWSELAWSQLCFTERLNAHIIVYRVCVAPKQPINHHSQLPSDLSW